MDMAVHHNQAPRVWVAVHFLRACCLRAVAVGLPHMVPPGTTTTTTTEVDPTTAEGVEEEGVPLIYTVMREDPIPPPHAPSLKHRVGNL